MGRTVDGLRCIGIFATGDLAAGTEVLCRLQRLLTYSARLLLTTALGDSDPCHNSATVAQSVAGRSWLPSKMYKPKRLALIAPLPPRMCAAPPAARPAVVVVAVALSVVAVVALLPGSCVLQKLCVAQQATAHVGGVPWLVCAV